MTVRTSNKISNIPDISIIIVSYQTKKELADCLDSIFREKNISFEVIVVDNASTDGTSKMITQEFPKVKLITLDSLIGFSESNMRGVEKACANTLFFLNPDTLVRADAVHQLFQTLWSQKNYGAISGRLLNADGSLQPQGGSLPSLLVVCMWMFAIDDIPSIHELVSHYQERRSSYFSSSDGKVKQFGWLGGTALMVKKEAFKQVGGWDSNIYMYGEDVELCLRLDRAGWEIVLDPQAEITHLRFKSTGSSQRSLVGEVEGIVYIWKKHFPVWQKPVLILLLLIGAWLRYVLFGILLRDEHKKQAYRKIFTVLANY